MARSKITPKPASSTLPAHDVEGVGPGVLGRGLDLQRGPPSPARTTAAAAPSPNRAVATMLTLLSSSSRNDRVQSSITTSSTLRPGWARASRAARPRPETPPGAAQAEHRGALHVGAKAHGDAGARLQARRGDAGGGDGDDGVDVAAFQAGGLERPAGGRLEQRGRRPRDRRRCARASPGAEVPFDRLRQPRGSRCRRWRTPRPSPRTRRSGGRTGRGRPPPRRPASPRTAARRWRARAGWRAARSCDLSNARPRSWTPTALNTS